MPRIDSDVDYGGGGSGGGISVETDPLALKKINNLSDVINKQVALNNILPTQSAGKILESDGTNVSFVDKISASSKTTIVTVTSDISSGTSIGLVVSGVGYTKTGDNAFIGSNVSDFINLEYIQVYINGLLSVKQEDVIYVSSISISFSKKLTAGEKIIIFS